MVYLQCKICGRKIIKVQKKHGKYYNMYLKHGEYITTPGTKSEFDFHKPEIEVR